MTMTTTSGAVLLRPEEVDALLVTPVLAMSVAAQDGVVATVRRTAAPSYRVPKVTADPSADWVAEGDEITVTDADLDELVITPTKIAGLTIVSNELAADTSPEAATEVGQGLARDIARRVDAAFFGNLRGSKPAAQDGLESLATTAGHVQTVAAGPAFTDLDPFAEAQSKAENVGAAITAFIANPVDALALAELKSGTDLNTPLLGTDPTQPGRRVIFGVPLLRSPAVTAGHVWALDVSRCYVVVRQDASVVADGSPFFTSDRTAVRGTMRVGFGFPHEAAVVRITLG